VLQITSYYLGMNSCVGRATVLLLPNFSAFDS
jgi:hypothetical protein